MGGATLNNTNNIFALGDDAGNRQYRAILSFGTSGLPDNATIQSAVLKIKQYDVFGENPFTALTDLRVDIITGAFSNNLALETADFNATASDWPIAIFNETPVNSWYSTSINSIGRNDINRVGPTQFRLRFYDANNNNNTADFMRFFSGDYTTDRPQLIITYMLP